MEQFVELTGREELAGLLGGGRVGGANQVGRVGRARGERNRSVTTNRTRVEEAKIVETEIAGVVETTREGSQGRLTRNIVRSLSI